MSLKDMFHRILFMILLIPLFFSFIHHNFLLTIISMAIAFIMAWMFIKFKNYNKKHYFMVVILLLLCLTGLYLIVTRDYSLESLSPFFGGLIIALIYVNGWEKIVLINKSTSLIKEYKIEEAVPYFNRILELDPKNFYALYNKAVVYNETGKYEESLELSDKVLKENKKDVYTLNVKANSLIKLKRYDNALEIIDRILKKDSKNEISLANKARALSGQGKYLEAIKYFEDALKRISTKGKWKYRGMPIKMVFTARKLAELWTDKGKAHEKLGQNKEALKCFNKALELYPDSGEALKFKEEIIQMT